MKAVHRNLKFIWVVSLILSLAVGFGFYESGRAGDCAPHEIDGQCGMSTFVGLLYGTFAGATILVSMTVYVCVTALKRRRTSRTTSSDDAP